MFIVDDGSTKDQFLAVNAPNESQTQTSGSAQFTNNVGSTIGVNLES